MEFLTSVGIGVGVAGLVTIIFAYITSKLLSRERKTTTIEDRIATLTDSLKSSIEVISELESEIDNRSKMVSKLKDDAERYEKLKVLNEEQVEAIAQTFRGEIKSESKKSIWRNAIINFVVALLFFLLGYLIRGGI